MAYINKRDRFNAIRKVAIQFGTSLGCEKDEEAEIIVREPTEIEVLDWNEANSVSSSEGMKRFKELLTAMIVSHNLMEDEQEKMSNEAVVDLIYSKTDIVQLVVEEWSKKVFRTPQSRREGR